MSELRPDERVCPYCAETIKAAAIRCRYCQADLAPAPEAAPASAPAPVPGPAPVSESAEPPAAEPTLPLLASARLMRLLVAACVVLALVAGASWWWADRKADDPAAKGPITSSSARDSGLAAATRLTQQVLSYDWKTLDKDIAASQEVLTPSFRTEYGKAMAGVRDQTIKNQVRLTAAVVATSIVSASEKKVEALVFVNQLTSAKGTENQRLDQNRVLVTLSRHGEEWRVSKMDAF